MFCTVCKNHKKKNAFATSGSSNFRRSAFIDHSKSLEHTDAICAILEAKQAAPIFATLSEQADKAMLTLMKAAYFVAKEDLAILKFGVFMTLLERCQSPHLPRELYGNCDRFHKLVTVIGEFIESELVELMCNSPFLGLMIDESTDLRVRKNLCIYINTLTLSSDISSNLANIAEMKQCDANTLTKVIVNVYLEEKQIDYALVGGAPEAYGSRHMCL